LRLNNKLDTIKEILSYINKSKMEIIKSIKVDKAIDADNYDNVARLKVCEKIEKYILQINNKSEESNK